MGLRGLVGDLACDAPFTKWTAHSGTLTALLSERAISFSLFCPLMTA